MNEELLRYQKIEDYLKGNMSEDEKMEFKSEMEKNSELSEEVKIQEMALMALEMEYLKTISKTIKRQKLTNNFTKLFTGGLVLLTLSGSFLLYHFNLDNKSTNISGIRKNINLHEQITTPLENKEITYDNSRINNSDSFNESANTKNSESNNLAFPDTSSQKLIIKEISRNNEEILNSPMKSIDTLKTKKTDCNASKPEIKVKVKPTSYDIPDGEITISIPDNKTWQIFMEGANDKFENTTHFTNLSNREYKLFLRNQDCTFEMGSYSVDIYPCSHKKDYVFNIITDNEWNIPVNSENSVKLSIINKAGLEVFNGTFNSSSEAKWNGTNFTGSKLPIGLYKAIIILSENKTCIYNVVISE